MIKEFRLPDLGEGLTESEILSWKVRVGDTVSLNQVIAEVETAKAVVELPSPFAGVIRELHEQPGTVVEVGRPIVSFEVADDAGRPPSGAGGTSTRAEEAAGEEAAGEAAAGPAAGPAAGTPQRKPNLVGYGAVVEGTGKPVRRPRNFPSAGPAKGAAPALRPAATNGFVVKQSETAPVASRPAGSPHTEPAPDRPRSTPPVRKLAKDLGVDLSDVPGTGPQGLITREDVQHFVDRLSTGAAAGPQAAASAETTARQGARETRTPIKGVRKLTASAMVQSAFTAPHATEFLTVDVTPAMELLAKLRDSREFAGIKLTPLTLAAKALLIALKRSPALNSRWDGENQEIVTFNYVNLGIAAATPRGLTVPNIKDADGMSLVQLAEALSALAETARTGKTAPADLSGGTISITNIGVFGIDAGTPILNPGEAGILALGAVRKMPWEYQGRIALRQVMTLSLSFDHRLVDGEQGSRFLADVGAVLADPGMVLTMV
ncbi:dihydrolipoamide acetyltransferase family protein [Pseudarthrobacter sp. NamB4]|uniref:dihydrolipoamide acetyltransferase family protein n=1 Tax=Pseudarthrobacter sp. NamB4 TaxID=2576837 RepID=UPI0010FEFEC9|nr:dihydrolipoamide acetyltransferase family protein [Pseudarthrobacter sp. NamB4]TLM74136.1 2-oxo acid dehydrogenase subunit E2 [Pseudarthrobacter sp. NamB4]